MWYIPPRDGPAGTEAPAEFVGTGYSGFGAGLNNPLYVLCRNDAGNSNCSGDAGPIPEVEWSIGPPQWDHPKGKPAFVLTPKSDIGMFNRDSTPPFMIHGDDSCKCFTASGGCIVIPDRKTRIKIAAMIAASGDRDLRVVP